MKKICNFGNFGKAGKISRLIALAFFALFAAAFPLAPANAAQVAVTVETLTAGGGFIVEPMLWELPSGGATAAEVLDSVLKSKGITFSHEDSLTSEYFYVTNIGGLTAAGTNGWMITVNNSFIDKSAGVWALHGGDVMRWQYTKNLGGDIGTDPDFLGTNTLPSKDALIKKVAEINAAGNKSSYGGAYDTALSVMKKLAATKSEIDAALAKLNGDGGTDNGTGGGGTDNGSGGGTDSGSDTDNGADNGAGGGTDNGTSTGGASAVVRVDTPITPPSGIKAGSGTRAVKESEVEGLGFGDYITATNGVITVKEAAFVSGLTGTDKTSVDTGTLTSLPVFRTGVAAKGTALVTLKLRLDKYKGEALGSIAVLKMKNDGLVRKLTMAQSSEELASGSFVWTDEGGKVKLPSEKAAAGQDYFISVAIADDSDYDHANKTPGTIVDPLALAIGGTSEGNTGNDDNTESGGGGCDTGAFGIIALAALAVAVRRAAAFSPRSVGDR
jgi:hypothetical protein